MIVHQGGHTQTAGPARPLLRSLDIRTTSDLTGSIFGGTVTNNGHSNTFEILGDYGSIVLSLDNLSANCQATAAAAQAHPFIPSSVE